VTRSIACIVADWGTTNLRAWAMAADGTALEQRDSQRGLLAVEAGRFSETLEQVCGDWLIGPRQVPVVMSGMVGSKLGWKEAPYLAAPVALDDLGHHLCSVEAPSFSAARIVPGIKLDDPAVPDVIRGEETQILGALQTLGMDNGVFLLPGTHSKWAIVEGRMLVAFRTYMTGELYGLLRRHGTIGQLMDGDTLDDAAFRRGMALATSPDARSLLHDLFSVRTLGLLDRLPRQSLASYMSGLLIGTEMKDALAWLKARGKPDVAIGIGSSGLLDAYRKAASFSGLEFGTLDNAAVVPRALLSIAVSAGLVTRDAQKSMRT
jgi:2-dehydro-3-deoxygalactonokinase